MKKKRPTSQCQHTSMPKRCFDEEGQECITQCHMSSSSWSLNVDKIHVVHMVYNSMTQLEWNIVEVALRNSRKRYIVSSMLFEFQCAHNILLCVHDVVVLKVWHIGNTNTLVLYASLQELVADSIKPYHLIKINWNVSSVLVVLPHFQMHIMLEKC